MNATDQRHDFAPGLTAARQAGFTLVEVLLAMLIVSMILIGLYNGMRAGTRAVDRGEKAVDRTNNIRIVSRFLRTQLMQMMPLQISSETVLEEGEIIYFEGDDRGIRFAGPMPGYLSNGGPHEQHIFFDRGPDGMELLFDHRVINLEEDWPDSGERDPVVLMRGIERASFEFLEPPEDPEDEPQWVSNWESPTVLPLMVRLEVEMAPETRVVFPKLDVRPRVDAATAGRRLDRPFVLPSRNRQ